MDKRELQDRTKQFALRVLTLVDALPRTAGGRAISMQLVRAATSVGANYRSACRARSRAEFAAKLGIALEEADESFYWLELVRDGKILDPRSTDPDIQGVRRMTEMMASHPRLSATAIPTVGARGYDGFAIAMVLA